MLHINHTLQSAAEFPRQAHRDGSDQKLSFTLPERTLTMQSATCAMLQHHTRVAIPPTCSNICLHTMLDTKSDMSYLSTFKLNTTLAQKTYKTYFLYRGNSQEELIRESD